jgi:hypothetical protein
MTASPLPPRQPQPVLAAASGALLVEILSLLVASGVPISDEQRLHAVGIVGAAGTLIGLLFAWRASRRVTPVDSPRDNQGRALLPGPDDRASS